MKFMVLNFWVITYTFHSTNNSLSKHFVIFVNCNFLKEPLSRCFIYSISMHMHIVLYINQSNFVWFVEPVGIFIRTNKASPHQARHVYFSKVGSSSLVWDNSGISLNVEYSYILPIPFVISKTNVYLLKSNDQTFCFVKYPVVYTETNSWITCLRLINVQPYLTWLGGQQINHKICLKFLKIKYFA